VELIAEFLYITNYRNYQCRGSMCGPHFPSMPSSCLTCSAILDGTRF